MVESLRSEVDVEIDEACVGDSGGVRNWEGGSSTTNRLAGGRGNARTGEAGVLQDVGASSESGGDWFDGKTFPTSSWGRSICTLTGGTSVIDAVVEGVETLGDT